MVIVCINQVCRLALVLLLNAVGVELAAAEQELLWYRQDFSPANFSTGPYRGQGYQDRLMREWIPRWLPQYRHRQVLANGPRFYADLRVHPNICATWINYSAERASLLTYSRPIAAFFPQGLLVRTADQADWLPMLDREGRISLKAWLAAGHRLGIMRQYFRSDQIGQILQGAETGQVVAQDIPQEGGRMLQMLALKRGLDGVYAYAFEQVMFEKENRTSLKLLSWLPITEQPSHKLAYIACTRSALGEKVIAQLNQVLQDPQQQRVAQQLYSEWLSPQEQARLAKIDWLKPDHPPSKNGHGQSVHRAPHTELTPGKAHPAH